MLLIGDRGFGGRDRVRFLKGLLFQYLMRVNGDTQIFVGGQWRPLSELAPGSPVRLSAKGEPVTSSMPVTVSLPASFVPIALA